MGGSVQITKGLTMEKRCGTCRFVREHYESPLAGFCYAYLPFWVKGNREESDRLVLRTDGTDCPCFSEKEA